MNKETHNQRCNDGNRGQTLIFLMMVLAVLAFVMLSVYDVQQVAVARVRSQNGSDAAALAGARWQVSTLNAIGEINLLKLTTAIITDVPPGIPETTAPDPLWKEIFRDLDELQRRISLIGPMLGVLHAQQAAKLNGMHNVDDYTAYINGTIQYIQSDPLLMTDPVYSNDILPILQELVSQGVAALPAGSLGNPSTLDTSEATHWAHYLFQRYFYGAITGQDWCYLKPLLFAPYSNCQSFWGVIGGETDPADAVSFLPLWLQMSSNSSILAGLDAQQLAALQTTIAAGIDKRGLDMNPNWPSFATTNLPQFSLPDPPFDASYVPLNLYTFRANNWNWGSSDTTNVTWLMRSDFKPQFKYKGADSVWTSQASANVTMVPANPNQVSWTGKNQQSGLRTAFGDLASIKQRAGQTGYGIQGSAAAKPFGQIDDQTPPNAYNVVLPVFDTVRLIPIAFSSATGEFDPQWFIHLRDHLHVYTTRGINYIPASCPYCRGLIMWESPAFRQIGITWWNSQTNANPCAGGGPPPSHPGLIVH